ncbi:retrovirus-related pol polyprotein from transposon TNT 1-94 [Tanacetum coccineum]|uniref:Retrovirus-related pol polyprotein from transposon TNT 1-94 n=1 Tax=Tanacetum coccineum TaxID=301880 RepID=A0ABQ5EEJ8_9ASTR
MVQTKSRYKASGEPVTVLQQHRRPPHAKGTTSTMNNTEVQPSGKDNLAAKVNKLSKELEFVISWIRDQPPKAHVTPVKERYAEYKFEDDDIEDKDDGNKKMQSPHYPFKVEARIDIPTNDGTVDAEKLDSWIDQLETYFPLYGFSSSDKVVFARLTLTSHALAWWNSQLKTRGEDVSWKEFTRLLRQEFYPMRITGHTEECWKVHPELFPKKWIKDNRRGKRTTATAQSLNTKEQPDKREELFTLHIQVKQELIEAIVDTGSQKNLISAGLVQRLGLTTTPHPHEVLCEVVPLDIFQGKYLVNRSKGTRNVEFTMACQARRLVNASQVVLLSLVRPIESADKVSALSQINNQPENAKATYPTVGMYRNLALENDEIKRHDRQRVEGNFQEGDRHRTEEKPKTEGKKIKLICYGSFRILKKIDKNACQLKLPAYMEMYPVVNVDKLKLFKPSMFDEKPLHSFPSLDKLGDEKKLIMEYLVKISKKARILELKRRHLNITVLTSNMPYPSRKIRRICACASLKTTKEQDPIRRIQRRSLRHIQVMKIKYSGRYRTWSLLQETPDTPY